ncbi:MAG: hypothetical protein C4293_08205 [Nitrospiraceae bacterium]
MLYKENVTAEQNMRKRLLLVEDELDTQQMVRKLLEGSGYAVETVFDGAEALGAIQMRPFDGMILDIILPELDGIEVVRQLKASASPIPVVMLSAYQQLALQAVREGAQAYIVKPFDAARLRHLVEHWVGPAGGIA